MEQRPQIDEQTLLASNLMGAKLDIDEANSKKRGKYHVTDKATRGQHLKPHRWKKGQSGNPKGRPIKPLSIVSLVKEHLENHPEDGEAIALALIHLAKAKNLWAIESVMNRVDGKVAEVHKLEGELPIRIEFIPAHILLGNRGRDVIGGEVRELLEEGKDE